MVGATADIPFLHRECLKYAGESRSTLPEAIDRGAVRVIALVLADRDRAEWKEILDRQRANVAAMLAEREAVDAAAAEKRAAAVAMTAEFEAVGLLDEKKRKAAEVAAQVEELRAAAAGVRDDTTTDELDAYLARSKGGLLARIPGNVELILCHHPEWRGALGYNEMTQSDCWLGSPPAMDGYADRPAGIVLEGDWARVQSWIHARYETTLGREAVETGMANAARARSFHPVRDYLARLSWDGTPRLADALHTYFGVDVNRGATEDAGKRNAYVRAVSRAFFVAAVARVIRPGCKVDTMLLLEGEQGLGKSRGLRALCADEQWFDDQLPELDSKDSQAHLSGVWIQEIAELASFSKHEAARIKAFLSKQVDRFRPSYGRRPVSFPRTCVFAATVNDAAPLTDPTGARRFWPVHVTRAVNVEALERDRDQLWAEAVVAFKSGEAWHLSPGVELTARDEQAARFVRDPWEEVLTASLGFVQGDPPEPEAETTTADALTRIGVEAERRTRSDAMRVATILARLGYRRQRLREKSGARAYVYRLTEKGSEE